MRHNDFVTSTQKQCSGENSGILTTYSFPLFCWIQQLEWSWSWLFNEGNICQPAFFPPLVKQLLYSQPLHFFYYPTRTHPHYLLLSVPQPTCAPWPACLSEVIRTEILAWERTAVWPDWARQLCSLRSSQQPSKQEDWIRRDKTLFIFSQTAILIRLLNRVAQWDTAWGLTNIICLT